MRCPECEATRTTVFSVPPSLDRYAESGGGLFCGRCLAVSPVDPKTTECPSAADVQFDAVADWFPGGEAGVAMALLLDKLESLALNRAAIEALVEAVETRGSDPLVALDRLADDDAVEPRFDLDRRRTQLLQLLE
ncbi:DUF6276 family protein [Haloferacaceae archaeon DSL9]